jgi:hypothetical protein
LCGSEVKIKVAAENISGTQNIRLNCKYFADKALSIGLPVGDMKREDKYLSTANFTAILFIAVKIYKSPLRNNTDTIIFLIFIALKAFQITLILNSLFSRLTVFTSINEQHATLLIWANLLGKYLFFN